MNIKKIDKETGYGSHIPVVLACMESFPKKKIVEFGSGLYSTPIFYEHFQEQFISIEGKKEWYDFVRNQYAPKEGFSLIHNANSFDKRSQFDDYYKGQC
jgi:hypothetical protein